MILLLCFLFIIILILLFGGLFVRQLLGIGCGLLCLFILFLFFFAMCATEDENQMKTKRRYNTIDPKYDGMTADELQKKFLEEDKAKAQDKNEPAAPTGAQ